MSFWRKWRCKHSPNNYLLFYSYPPRIYKHQPPVGIDAYNDLVQKSAYFHKQPWSPQHVLSLFRHQIVSDRLTLRHSFTLWLVVTDDSSNKIIGSSFYCCFRPSSPPWRWFLVFRSLVPPRRSSRNLFHKNPGRQPGSGTQKVPSSRNTITLVLLVRSTWFKDVNS